MRCSIIMLLILNVDGFVEFTLCCATQPFLKPADLLVVAADAKLLHSCYQMQHILGVLCLLHMKNLI